MPAVWNNVILLSALLHAAFAAVFAAAVAAEVAAAQQPVTWRLVEEWRVGGGVEGAHALDGVADLSVFADGRIVVADRTAGKLHFLDSRGQPVRSVGGKGGGPGEFTLLRSVAISPRGEVVTGDPFNARFSVFAANGDFGRVISQPSLRYVSRMLFDTDGRAIENGNVVTNKTIPPEFAPATFRWSADFSRVDTLFVCDPLPPIERRPGAVEVPMRMGSGRGVATYLPAFTTHRIEMARDALGYEWMPRTFDSNDLVRRAHGSCTATATARLSGRVPIPKIVRDSQINGYVKAADVPHEFAWFEALHVDALNRLWVERRATAATWKYDVFGVTGQPVATVDLPARFAREKPIVITADRLFGFVNDEDDVKYLVSYRIARN